jgi:hypothetical protein
MTLEKVLGSYDTITPPAIPVIVRIDYGDFETSPVK